MDDGNGEGPTGPPGGVSGASQTSANTYAGAYLQVVK